MEYLPLLVTLVPFFSAWLDSRRLRADIPEKAIDNVSKSIELMKNDNDYLREKDKQNEDYKKHLLEYIQYLWVWIKKHKPKRVKYPKVLESFVMRSK